MGGEEKFGVSWSPAKFCQTESGQPYEVASIFIFPMCAALAEHSKTTGNLEQRPSNTRDEQTPCTRVSAEDD